MSLNKFTDINEEHKWMNINCNSLKVNGVSVAGTIVGQYTPTITPVTLGVSVTGVSPVIYEITSDSAGQKYITLKFRGFQVVKAEAGGTILLTFNLPAGYSSTTPSILENAGIIGSAVDTATGTSFSPISSNYDIGTPTRMTIYLGSVDTTSIATFQTFIQIYAPVASI